MMRLMNDREAVKAFIINDDGQYLAGTATDWEFTDDRGKATVFDYLGDRVANCGRSCQASYQNRTDPVG